MLTAALYSPLWSAPFVYEDGHWLATVDKGPHVPVVLGRALTVASYHVNWRLDGWDPRGYHVGNVLIHLVNGMLVWRLGGALLTPVLGVLASGLFLLHPLNSEAASYVSARSDLLMTTGILLAVWLSLGRWTVWRGVGVGLALLVAASSKEIGLVGVLLVVWTLALWRAAQLRPAVVAPLWIALGAILGLSWTTVASWWVAGTGNGAVGLAAWSEVLPRQHAAIWHLLRPDAWLTGLTLDHDFTVLTRFAQLLAGLLTLLVLALAAATWRRWPLFAWAAGWTALCVAPRLLFRTNEWINEHQLYAATAALSVLGAWGCHALWTWQPRRLLERMA